MTILLRELGHEVSGYSLEPVEGGLFDLAGLESQLKGHTIGDVRDVSSLKSAMNDSNANFAIHLAAQPLVLASYADPIETYTTNVVGTLNFLKVITEVRNPPIALVVTTDKVYRDDGKDSYVETDALGGHDPYSASKAMADILTQSWAKTNPDLRIHIARAGNVIGAFDVSPNRLIPDIVRALSNNEELVVRDPTAVRPWQHVLDCLAGYLYFLRAAEEGCELPVALNFGPNDSNVRTVEDVVLRASTIGPSLSFRTDHSPRPFRETSRLSLDASKARKLLGWQNRIDFNQAINDSIVTNESASPLEIAKYQIKKFLSANEIAEWRN